jgi:Leucine-rich repeat (LRR) protein
VSASPPVPRPVLDPKECGDERRALAKREAALSTSPRCLELFRRETDLGFVKRLTLTSYEDKAVVDVSLIAKATALEDLSLSLVPLPALDPLKDLASLRSLRISTPVERLDAIRALTQLERLMIEPAAHGVLRDVSGLSGLSRLKTLSVRQDVDLTALARVQPQLEALVAPSATQLTALAGFPQLESLTIGCFESKTEPVAVPPKLRELAIECHGLPLPLDPLARFAELHMLDISETDPLSLDPVRSLKKLRRFDAHDSKLKNIGALSQCTALEWVDIHGTQVKSLAPIATLPRLKFIDAGDTLVDDAAEIARSRSLESLWLPGTAVKNVLPLSAIPSLRELMLPRACTRNDALALHRARPDLRIMAWVEKSEAEDPTCFR